MDEAVARRYFSQMASAMDHCHARNVFHRDLKPENILLDGEDNVKIADFGLASMLSKNVEGDSSFLNHTKCGSLMYAAAAFLRNLLTTPEAHATNARAGMQRLSCCSVQSAQATTLRLQARPARSLRLCISAPKSRPSRGLWPQLLCPRSA